MVPFLNKRGARVTATIEPWSNERARSLVAHLQVFFSHIYGLCQSGMSLQKFIFWLELFEDNILEHKVLFPFVVWREPTRIIWYVVLVLIKFRFKDSFGFHFVFDSVASYAQYDTWIFTILLNLLQVETVPDLLFYSIYVVCSGRINI